MAAAGPAGHIFIFVGVSGAGKSTICGQLAAAGAGELSISHTTRPRSAQEEDGVHYHFVSRPEFEELIATGAMVEHAEVHGQLYGTGRAWLDEACARGAAALLDIDIAGARQIRARYGDRSSIVFLLPPDLDALERRLRARKREDEDEIRRRLRHGLDEILQLREADYLLVNDDLEKAYAAARGIVAGAPEAEELRFVRQAEIAEQWLKTATDRIKSLCNG